MKFLYSFGVALYKLGIQLASLTGNLKAKLWITGRKDWKQKINSIGPKKSVRYWVHCSSLGEFEQGRPLIEQIRKREPEAEIILTFFSPSGYEIRKDYNVVNKVLYLPEDTSGNALFFIETLQPDIVFFIKYEYWYNYLSILNQKRIPIYMVSAIFRPNQLFFKWYGQFFRKMLSFITHFFVQDEASGLLLKENGFANYTIAGDTRFDRVIAVTSSYKENSLLSKFTSKQPVFIAGSTWPGDEELIIPSLDEFREKQIKVIFVPHEVNEETIVHLETKIAKQNASLKYLRYSKINNDTSLPADILIIDTIGLLSSAYAQAQVAYVGGGFGKGIHNVLEAAAFGIPVLFGPRYQKFREANELINRKAAFSIKSREDFSSMCFDLYSDEIQRKKAGALASEYVREQGGATTIILNHVKIGKQNHGT